MTNPPSIDASTDGAATVASLPHRPLWLLPVVIGLATVVAAALHGIAVIGAMFLPAAGFAIAGVVVVGDAVAIAALFRAFTGRWHPLASTTLALLTALAHWLPIVGPVPMLFAALSAMPLVLGAVIGALSMLALPGRWRVAGAVCAAVVAVVSVLAVAVGA